MGRQTGSIKRPDPNELAIRSAELRAFENGVQVTCDNNYGFMVCWCDLSWETWDEMVKFISDLRTKGKTS